ncbi:MAG: ShlB/FhaC/HecB family hemolysin secretion/activation protein [Alphaproteobacteria bacterium]
MKISSQLLLSACALGWLAAAAPAFAQAVPGSADATRVGGQIAPLRTQADMVSGVPVVSSGGVNAAPEGADQITLVLKEVKIEGMTAYDEMAAEAVYRDMLDKTVTLADVFAIADRLTAKYRNDGYILTQVILPPQEIDGGVVRLQVVEGFVDKVNIQSGAIKNPDFLTGFADKIRASKPLNSKTLERYLLLINDLSGMQARAVLSPSATPGASDITLVMEQKPLDLFLQADNRGSRYLGPLQVNAGARFANTFGLFEGISLQAVATPDDAELLFGTVTWQQPLNHEGTSLSIGGGITETEPGHTLSQFGVEGLSRTLNIELAHPFIRSRNLNLFVTGKLNLLDSERHDNLGGPETEDKLRVARLAATLQFADRFMGQNSFSCEASKGLDILGASDEGDANLTRALGDPQFSKITAEVSRVQRVASNIDIFLSASGQATRDTLLASEEFGVGGQNFGSAYDNSEITGEHGVAGRAELRLNNPFPVPAAQFVQFYGFFDGGRVWDKDNILQKDRQRSVVSTGAGFRATVNENFAATVELALPLTRRVEAEGDNNARIFGSITLRY